MSTGPDPGRAPVDAQSAAESLLKRFSKFIAWFSGSVAGISAIVYSIGFVAYKAADKALGIGVDLASRDNFLIVVRGVSVVARTAIFAVWGVLLVIALVSVFRFAGRRLRLAERATTGPAVSFLADLAAPVTALAMVAVAGYALARFSVPALDVQGLLFATAEDDFVCPEEPIQRAVMAQDRESLEQAFGWYSIFVGLNLGLWLVAWPKLTAPGQGLWMMLAGVGGFLSILGAPVAYGALLADRTAPEVEIGPPPDDNPGPMRLLSRDASGILVWLETQGQIRWISAAKFSTLTIGKEKTLMKACRDPNAPDRGDER